MNDDERERRIVAIPCDPERQADPREDVCRGPMKPLTHDETDKLIKEALDLTVSINMSKAELLDAQQLTERAIFACAMQVSSMKGQLDRAHERREHFGEMADRAWWRRLNTALRYKGSSHQHLQYKLGEIIRLFKLARSRSREILFIDIARNELPKETYLRIWQRVNEALDRDPAD